NMSTTSTAASVIFRPSKDPGWDYGQPLPVCRRVLKEVQNKVRLNCKITTRMRNKDLKRLTWILQDNQKRKWIHTSKNIGF
ncbi:hypothetical protein C5167_048965, partial [Papaver somniferum]